MCLVYIIGDKMKRKLKNKMNYLSCKIDIVNSLMNILIESLYNDNLTKKDSKNLIYILENRIKDIKLRYSEIIREFDI